MQTVAEILKRIETTVEEKAKVLESSKLSEQKPQEKNQAVEARKGSDIAANLSFTKDQRLKLISELGACVMLQRTYNKINADDIPTLANLLIEDLKEYEPQEVLKAVRECRKLDTEFVTLASVLKILNPQPKFDYAVYTRIVDKLKRGEGLKFEERLYMEAYEKNAMKGL